MNVLHSRGGGTRCKARPGDGAVIMQWRVKGALRSTGEDVSRVYDAGSEESAKLQAHDDGILVESASPISSRPSAPARAAVDPPPVAPPIAKPVPAEPLHQSGGAAHLTSPSYLGLAIAGRVVSVFAVLYYLAGALALVAVIITAATGPAPGARWSAEEGFMMVLIPLSIAMVGGLLHGISAACFALRDIARNSWR